jgi:molybdate transport system substrate-binding protein
MRAMAATDGHPVGCTQATEILATSGVTLVGPLPDPFGLATVYSCGIPAAAGEPELARRLAALLTSPQSREVHERLGFRDAA